MSRILRYGLLAVLFAVPFAIPAVSQASPVRHGHRVWVRSSRYCGPTYHHYRHGHRYHR